VRASGLGDLGLGGLGLPGMESMFNGMPDSNQMNQLLQNPAVSQMMQTVLSNPEYMNQVLLLLKVILANTMIIGWVHFRHFSLEF
jgi:ubiquilin